MFSDCLFDKSIINNKNIIGVDTATIIGINIDNNLIYNQDAILYIKNNYINN